MTHGAVSQQIRRLEAELGAALFERRGNRMEPTPEGQRLADEVARALEILRQGVTAFTGATHLDPLVLSVGGFMARRWLPPRLPRLLADPAGAGLQIQVVDRQVDLVAEGVDAAVRNGPGQWEGMISHRLYTEDMYPVCAPQVARTLAMLTPQDVLQAPLLHLRSRPWTIWFDKFGGEVPTQGRTFDDALLMMGAAAQGLGVALAVGGLVEEELRSGRLVRPLGEGVAAEVDVFLIWPRGSRKQTRIHALRDWLLAEVAASAAS